MSSHATPLQLDQARRCLLEAGEVPHGLVDDALCRSWERSRHAGLSPVDAPSGPPICSEADLRQALAHSHDFLAQARPVMEFVFEQMRDCGNLVVLSDARGLLLHSLGDADFVSRADRVSLRPGALWHESDRGTNAIGTALAEARPVVIHGAEHYLERNGFLTCAAAPVTGPNGSLRGVIDISGDRRGHHPHTFAMVRSAARMIEDRLFHARHGRDLIVRLHPQPEGLGGVGEGLVALSEDGWIVGANAPARQWLGLHDGLIGTCTLEQITGQRIGLWRPGKLVTLRTAHDKEVFARLDAANRPVINMPFVDVAERRSTGQGADSRTIRSPDVAARDPRVTEALRRARRVQAQGIPVLIQGESGTGKEVFARTLHSEGPRAHKPFVAVNCAALPETLIEAELFGYVGGAFTGARREGSPGRIREADGGTLFLDEIGDMPLALQARLLRVLQDKVVVPLGGSRPVPVDFVLVCATHRRLKEAIQAGAFREDLYYRVNGLTVSLPALRDRHDFPAVLRDVLNGITLDMHRPPVDTVHPGLLQALAAYAWPGNLRQLHATLRTACALLEPDEVALDWSHLPEDTQEELGAPPDARASLQAAAPGRANKGLLPSRAPSPQAMPVDADQAPAPATHAIPDANLRRLSDHAIRQVVQATGGNMSEAARRLGISRNTLYRRLKSAGDPRQSPV
ncbi:MAG: sigma 54-interacting transcriptional regulator [Aquabacterium sp.]